MAGRSRLDGAVDGDPPFLPEGLTPLAHTPVYATLTDGQRRRYNRLHAVYVNEQILFFEKTLAANILTAILAAAPPAPLERSLRAFLDDEAVHARMFREFNRACMPDLYGDGDFHFVRVAPAAARALAAASRHPRALPLFVWLMLLLEERAIHYAGEIVRARRTLAPAYVALHRRHLADEIRHVRWDQELLDLVWPATPHWRRRVNGWLFRWLVGEFFNVPKRASVRVVDELARRCPELADRRGEMRRQLRALAGDPAYHRSLYSRAIVPHTFARVDASPELHGLGHVLRGYRPRPPGAP